MGRAKAGDYLNIIPDEGDEGYEVLLTESEGYWEVFKAIIPGTTGIGLIALSTKGRSRWIRHPEDDMDAPESWESEEK